MYFCCNEIIWGQAAWVHQAYDTGQLNLFYVIIGLTHYEKQTSEEFAQIVSSLLGHRSAVDGVNIEFLWIGAVSACD